MSNRLNGASIFSQAINGLLTNYTYLMSGNDGKGLSIDNITNPSDKTNKNYLNPTFTTFLSSNFGKIDKDGDGIISAEEMQNYTNNISQGGMTYDQICQLCYSQGGGNTLLETVLNNFSEIDANGDGKVTNQEIAAFGINEEIDEMKDKYPKHDVKGMSIFYDTGSSSDTSDSSSKVNS